jgi:hypothetical protein
MQPFVLLDEILRGTNSMINETPLVKKVIANKAIGATTHDIKCA